MFVCLIPITRKFPRGIVQGWSGGRGVLLLAATSLASSECEALTRILHPEDRQACPFITEWPAGRSFASGSRGLGEPCRILLVYFQLLGADLTTSASLPSEWYRSQDTS